MPIADDWDFNYASKVISHIDGILSYDTGAGRQAAVGEYVYGATSGAVGKVLARTGNTVSGTLTLTNVLGQFANNELLEVLSELMFDGVVNAYKARIVVGATVTGASSGSTLVVKFIEYNIDGVAGHGKLYGTPMSALFTNNEGLQFTGGVDTCALADGTGVDNDGALTTTLVDGTLAVPGTANTNNCCLISYDAGSYTIPADAHLTDATTGATGYAQKVFGTLATGSIRVIDSNTTAGAWTNNNTLRILDCVYYDNLVAGKVFNVGDVIKAVGVGTAVGRVLAVIDDGDSTGKLMLANFAGTWDDADEIQVLQSDSTYVKYGEVENGTNKYLNAAVLNGSARTLQRADQGGVFPTASLNLVRSSNALYSYAMELFAALAQMDDDTPLEGNVKDQLYTILNSYIIPDLSLRFLEKGSFKDTANNNIWTAVQTTGAIFGIGNHGFYYDAANPTPQPDMKIEQDSLLLRQDWLEGNVDYILKTKTSTNPKYINPTVPALGQVINSGAFTVHLRPYGATYDSNEVTQVGGIATVALGNARDLNNTTAQYSAATVGGAGTFIAGEEATTASGKRVVINAAFTGGGTAAWNNKGSVNLINTDAITGSVSGATTTINAVPTNVVAGYGTHVRVMAVQRRFTGGATMGTYLLGEVVTQTGTGATGYFMEDDGGTLYVEEQSGTFNGTGLLTGGTSGATNTPSGTAAYSTVPKDIGGGVGDINYTAVVTGNLTGAAAQTLLVVYEWWKFITRIESAYEVNKPGLTYADYWLGDLYRRLQTTFAETRGASPFGAKAGALVIGAQGVFIEKYSLDADDIRNIQLVGNDGVTYNPPNLQVLEMANLFAGVRAAVYRSTGAGLTTILRSEFKVGVVGAGNNQAGDSYILVAAQTRTVSPLPSDVPDSGSVRVLDPAGTGDYLRILYDSVDRPANRFHLTQGVGQDTIGDVTGALDLIADNYLHVVFIEEEAVGTTVDNIVQYLADVPLVGIARKKGYIPFRTPAVFGATGVSIGAVLTPDGVVNLP